MTSLQKVIKYLALAFAVYLCFNIFYGIIYGFSLIIGNNQEVSSFMNVISNSSFDCLDLELDATSLELVKGDKFSIESNNDNIKIDVKDNITYIKDKGNFNGDKRALKVYIPTNINSLNIKIGAGSTRIDDLSVNNFSFKSGAGEVKINNLNVINSFDLKGGAGEIDILNSNISNLSLKLGIGEFDFSGTLKGDNNIIESGVGEVDIDFTDDISLYTIKASKGLGNININNNKVSNNSSYGTGSNIVNIKGGIGEVSVN